MAKAKLFKAASPLLVLALVLALTLVPVASPQAVSAATGQQGVTGTANSSNVAPSITAVTLKNATYVAASAMTPQITFALNMTISDNNTLDDISTINIAIYHDASAGSNGTRPSTWTSSSWDADECAIYNWTKTGGWAMVNGSAITTWTLNGTINSDTPSDLTLTEDTWSLAFNPGKLAMEADGSDTDEWCFCVNVTDAAGATAEDISEVANSMSAYLGIATTVDAIDFGDVTPGGTAAIQTPASHILGTNVTSNDAYELKGNSTSPWTTGTYTMTLTGGNTTPTGTRQFALTVDDGGDASGHPTTAQAVNTTLSQITGLGSVAAPTTAATDSEGTSDTSLYMDILLGNDIHIGTYTGTIYLQAINA